MKRFDWQHWALFFGAPIATAFLDAQMHSTSPFSRAALTHAGMAAAMVGVALLKQFVQVPVVVVPEAPATPDAPSAPTGK